MANTQQAIGGRIREARILLGLGLAEGAERLGIGKSTLGAIETGARPVRAADLVKYAEQLGTTAGALVDAHEPVRMLTGIWYKLDAPGRLALEQVAMAMVSRDAELMRELLARR